MDETGIIEWTQDIYPSDIQDIYEDTEEYLSEEEDDETDSESDSSDEK